MFRLGFDAPGNYNLSDFYIQTLAILPFDKEASLERVEVNLLNKRNLCFLFNLISIFVMNMKTHLCMLNMSVKLDNIMRLMMINQIHLVDCLLVHQGLYK